MEILFYLLAAVTAAFNSLGALGKKYSNARTRREKFLNIAAFSLLVAAVMWAVFAFSGERVNVTVFIYSAVFAVDFVICNFALYAAMECGSLSKTNLFNALSLVIPTLAGIITWKDPFNVWLICGAFILMVVSFLLILLKKEDKEDGAKNSRVKWLIFNVIAFFTNGLASVIQKGGQVALNGEGVFSMTALSFTLTAVISLGVYAAYLVIERRRNAETAPSAKQDFTALWHNKKSVLFNAAGVGIVNLAVTFLSTRIPSAFLYPCVLGGSIIITAVFSAVFFKEKLNAKTIAGILCGTAAIVLFSL